jgi:hypothetical protein
VCGREFTGELKWGEKAMWETLEGRQWAESVVMWVGEKRVYTVLGPYFQKKFCATPLMLTLQIKFY